MNRMGRFAVCSALSAALLGVPVMAQNHDDHNDHMAQGHDGYVRHKEWKRGYHMKQQDWQRAQPVNDWRAHHLRQPPRGYEWREVDGNYVLAAVATGIIASAIIAAATH